VEKVIFESRPGHHVTAALYVPDGQGPFPGVLLACGHSANGKAAEAYQRASISLAKHGFVVLCYDPIGQGERYQILDDEGKPRIRSSTTEHTLAGIAALLVGWNTATFRIWVAYVHSIISPADPSGCPSPGMYGKLWRGHSNGVPDGTG